MRLFAIYGYSLTPYIIATILYVIPFTLTRWLMPMAAGAISMYFIFKEVKDLIEDKMHEDKQKFLAIGGYLVVNVT